MAALLIGPQDDIGLGAFHDWQELALFGFRDAEFVQQGHEYRDHLVPLRAADVHVSMRFGHRPARVFLRSTRRLAHQRGHLGFQLIRIDAIARRSDRRVVVEHVVVGQFVDTVVVITVIFAGIHDFRTMLNLMFTGYFFKVGYEAAATPLTYWAVNTLKRVEGVDVYDEGVDFNPFKGEKP